MKASIFYSWQSDLPGKTNRYYIEEAIKQAIKMVNKDGRIIACVDRDTKGEIGSPDIITSIQTKIDHSKFFICDVSLNENQIPNPNVLIELGYAIKTLGWSKIICLFNSQTGKIEDLPFDINHNRVTAYCPTKAQEKRNLAKIISCNINELFNKGELYNPIEDHIKKKIDYIFLEITKNIVNIFDYEKDINFAQRISELGDLSKEDIAQKLVTTYTLGFYYLFDYQNVQRRLEQLLDQLLSCNYFMDSWKISIIQLIDWIDMWDHAKDSHFSPNLFKIGSNTSYRIKDMHFENQTNPINSVLLLKELNEKKYVVIRGGSLKTADYQLAIKTVCIQEKYGLLIAKEIKEYFRLLDYWLAESGDEIILDPHYYILK